ncbi:uncharacterized protein I303_106053 [Kwoniella dejecticola CBS 10117]|uniref:GH18 domain-containing protein n=1 Tax=Kwoniella dejecticola CBS 10117 TaxID=1296121 RepID=A0A1A6A158_9TREE|nr:uncharacterized protein I303_06073 [Kwoniella dejecticola CBS 10117]OBR83790.1 hypothetical protein I303_06073 [Kwoniella dejecticola CBS 10117]
MEQIPIVGPMLSALGGESSAPGQGKRVIGYFTNWQTEHYPPHMVPVDELTHLNYSFAKVNEQTGEVTLSNPHTDTETHFRPQDETAQDAPPQQGHNLFGCLGAFFLMKKHNRNFKVMLSIGGATFSHAFKNMEYIHWRNTFVKSAVKLVEDVGLDGLDVDYEFPTNEQEARYYAQLLGELRTDLNNLADKLHQPRGQYLLSVAAPCGPDKMKLLHVKDMDKSLDFWNLMAYDFAGSWSKLSDHQANLQGKNASDISVDQAVKFYEKQGVHTNKLVIGIPLYGRTFEQTEGLNKPFHGSKTIDYKLLPVHGAQVHNDAHLGASWSYDAHKKELISYDNPEIARQKTKYISQNNLGGAMFWQLEGDKPHKAHDSLVKIVRENIGKLEKRPNELKYPYSKYDNLKGGSHMQ